MGAAVKPIGAGNKVRHKPPARRLSNASPLDKAKAHEVDWPAVGGIFEATRRIADVSFVYFIGEQDAGPVKIGVAKDPITRLRSMQTGNPRRLRLERVLVGDMAIEKLLHEFWERNAIVTLANSKKVGAPPGTEWFEPDVRAELYPIVDTAAARQVEFLLDASGAMTFEEVERIVRDAHTAHDFVFHQRDQARLLAAGAGYVTRRPSRL